jgi:hypothetical protein
MSLNRDITEPFMSSTLLRMKQDERQSDRSDNTLSTRTLSDHTKITTADKDLVKRPMMTMTEKDLDINTKSWQTLQR